MEDIINRPRPDTTEKNEFQQYHAHPPGAPGSFSSMVRNGMMGGVLMASYLVFLQVAGAEDTLWLKFIKYVFLAIVIVGALRAAREVFPPVRFFKQGAKLGAGISLIAGGVLVVVNAILFLINPEWTFNKFSLEAGNLGELIMLDVSLLFEVFVFGTIVITFICLQFLKHQDPDGTRVL